MELPRRARRDELLKPGQLTAVRGRLRRGRIERWGEAPTSVIPMRAPDGTRASHALPGTPVLSV